MAPTIPYYRTGRLFQHRQEELSAASEEQTWGIGQVHQAVSQMDQVTQQTASLVEQAAAAAASMQHQAGNLAQVVSVFKLDGMRSTAVAVPAQAQRHGPHIMVLTP